MAKITMATMKSFIRKNPNLYIDVKSKFDGMVDCCMPADDGFTPVEKTDRNLSNTLGINGAWFVLGGDDRFYEHEDAKFKGIEVYNCCGRFIIATKKGE